MQLINMDLHTYMNVFKGCQTKSSRDIRRHFRLYSDESAPIAVVQHLIPHCVSALSGMHVCLYVSGIICVCTPIVFENLYC